MMNLFISCTWLIATQYFTQLSNPFLKQLVNSFFSLLYYTCFLCFSEQNYFKAMNSRRVHALLFLLSSSLEKEIKQQ